MNVRDSKRLAVQFLVSRRRRIIGLVVLAALVTGGLAWRASWIAHRLLRSWTTATIRDQSEDAYRLAVGQVRLNPVLRRLTVDSLVLTTNATANALRPQALTTLGITLRACSISGVRLVTLARGGGLIADSLACELLSIRAVVPRGTATSPAMTPSDRRAFLALQQSVRLPSFAPQIRIARIAFPQALLDVRVEHAFDEDSRMRLEQLRWRMADFAIDAADTAAATHPLFSRVVEVSAANFVSHADSITTVRIDSLTASLTDSTLDIRGITYAPTLGNAAFAQARPYRRTLVRARIGRVAVRGIDVGAFLLGRGLMAKRVEVDSLRVNVTSDRRRPSRDGPPKRRRTPQEWIADLGRTVSVDSLLLRHGQVVYRLWREGREDPGIFTLSRISAAAANMRHATGKDAEPMTLRATAYLQNTGRLDAHFVVPIDAPRFTMSFRGTLGPMPAVSLNAIIEETFPLRIAKGQVHSVAFAAIVVNGSARGTVTPLYSGLAMTATADGRTGILARGGVLGGVARRIASMAGNWMKVYSDNPDDPHRHARVGVIRHTFSSNETLPAFLWTGLRGGLLSVMAR